MLVAWLGETNTQNWMAGKQIVQFQKNSSYHSRIKRYSYPALFGNEASVGLTTSTLSLDIPDNLESEQDLDRLNLPESASRADRDNSPSDSDTIWTAADPVDTTVTTNHATTLENGPVNSVGNVPSSTSKADPLQMIGDHASTSNAYTEFIPKGIIKIDLAEGYS